MNNHSPLLGTFPAQYLQLVCLVWPTPTRRVYQVMALSNQCQTQQMMCKPSFTIIADDIDLALY